MPQLGSAAPAVPGRYVLVENGETCLGKDLVCAGLELGALKLRLDRDFY